MLTKIGLQLMLVDPDDDLRFLLKALLELTGCQVETATNCAEAVALIEAGIPDVIFTELFLEDATGLDFGRRIRSMSQTRDTLLVALTGHSYQGIAQDVSTAGFDRFLLKPVQYDQILDILASEAKKYGRELSETRSLSKAA